MPGKRRGGANLPKAARYVKPGRPQVRLECESCGVHGPLVVSATPARAEGLCADSVALSCPDCGGRVLPSAVEDCERLAPHLLARHPVYIEDARAEGEAELGKVKREWSHAPDEECGHCEAPMPAHLDPDEWYCRHCGTVNGRRADGSRGTFQAAPFSPEVERCNGLAADKAVRSGRKVGREPERVQVAGSEYADTPF